MLTYNDIYEILRKEKYSEPLQPLPKSFISEFSQYINENSVDYTKTEILEMLKLKDRLVKGVLNNVQGSKLNGSRKQEEQLPNIANFSFLGVEGESLVISLDQEGIAVSTGSACTSTSTEPSHVLKALGLPESLAKGNIRITLGRQTNKKDIDYVLKILPGIVTKLRR